MGRERRWAWGSRGQRASFDSGPDTSQTPEDPFSPTQSRGVWEVHGVVVTGPEPEQVEDGRVVQLRHRGEPAEFPGVLYEGEVTPDEGEEAGGELHRRGGKKTRKQKLLKRRKTKRGRRSAAYFCFGPVFCHNFVGSRERGGEELLQITLLFTQTLGTLETRNDNRDRTQRQGNTGLKY